MNIRKMKVEDLLEVIRLESGEENFSVTPGSDDFWTNEQLTRSINSGTDILLVAEENNQIIGFTIALLHKPTNKAVLENIWTHPEHRKKGVGQQLIEKTLENLKNNGCTYVVALTKEANEPMLNLFSKTGFDKGYKFYWMSKFL